MENPKEEGYIVLTATFVGSLITLVNERQREGYRCTGGICALHNTATRENTYYQSMLK